MRITILLLVAVLGGTVFGSGIAAWSFYSFPEQASPESGLIIADLESSEKYPSVEVEKTEYNFGAMDSHATASHDFVFRNVGKAPLELEAGRTTCKCTLSDIGDDVIPPGESGIVTLEWSGKNNVGPYSQTATIITNDPRNPTIELSIHGEMTAKARFVPDTLVFSSITAGNPAHGSVRIFGYVDEPLEITGHEIDNPEGIEVSFSPIPEEEVKEEEYATSGQQVNVTIKSGLPPGPFHRKIHVKTGIEGLQELVIPVEGIVTSEISIFGSGWSSERGVLRLGRLNQSKCNRTLMLKVGGAHPEEVDFEIAEVQPEFVEVRLGEKKSSPGGGVAMIPLEIEIPAGSPPCNYFGPSRDKLGFIRLKTTHATVKELKIYLQFLISG